MHTVVGPDILIRVPGCQSTVDNGKYDECGKSGSSLKENLVGIEVLTPLIVAANEIND